MSVVLEQEAKFPLASLEDGRARLASAGARLVSEETFESNQLYDYSDQRLAKGDEALRLRRSGTRAWLTWKGPELGTGKIKERRELEVEVGLEESKTLEVILAALGLSTSFRYEKYRSYYRLGEAELALDRTPIGVFLEIEAKPEAIASSARSLSLDMNQAIRVSYPRLYAQHRAKVADAPAFMVFPEHAPESS